MFARVPSTRDTHRIPPALRGPRSRSLGQRRSSRTPQHASTPSAMASAAQNGTAHSASVATSAGRIVVNRSALPAGAIHARPALRPRPAVWNSATKVAPAADGSPSSAAASSFVLAVSRTQRTSAKRVPASASRTHAAFRRGASSSGTYLRSAMAVERTLILAKPDAVVRGLVGEILARFERRGYTILGLKLMHVTEELAKRHYAEHEGKGFFQGLVDYITGSPVVAMVIEGEDAIEGCRSTIGATNPIKAAPGSIRGDYGQTIGRNLVHGSDSPASAEREVGIFFRDDELFPRAGILGDWVSAK